MLPNHQLVMASLETFRASAENAYAEELSERTAQQILDLIGEQKYHRKGTQNLSIEAAKKLRNVSNKLFATLTKDAKPDDLSKPVVIDNESARQFNNIAGITTRLIAALHSEVFYRKAEEIIAWVRKRYNANLSQVDLGRLLQEASGTEAERNKQAVMLHLAICEQPGIAVHIANDARDRREPRFGINPEQYALQRERSSVKDVIWRRIEKLMLSESARCNGCETFYDLIWTLGQLRDCAENLMRISESNYSLECKYDETILLAKLKNLPERLYRDLWSRKIPIILLSDGACTMDDMKKAEPTLGLQIGQ